MIIRWSIIIFAMIQLQSFGQNKLTVEVSGIKAIQGDHYLSLYNRESSWLNADSAFLKEKVPVKKDPDKIILRDIPAGDYAIAIYQDMNANEIMDANEMRIPKEPYGFSNNPKGLRGPATYKQAVFHFAGQDTIRIELVNNIFTPNKEKNEKPE